MSLLQVKDVTHSYGAPHLFFKEKRRETVLSNITLSIEHGKCLSLLGTSGAGKSTLGKVILGNSKNRKGAGFFSRCRSL